MNGNVYSTHNVTLTIESDAWFAAVTVVASLVSLSHPSVVWRWCVCSDISNRSVENAIKEWANIIASKQFLRFGFSTQHQRHQQFSTKAHKLHSATANSWKGKLTLLDLILQLFCFLLCTAAELISPKLYICLSPYHREMRKSSELTLLLAFSLLNSRLFFGIVKRIVSKWAEDVIRCKIVFAFFISISLWMGGMSAHTTFSITTYAPLYAGCCWMQQSIKSVSGVKIFHFAGMYTHSISLVRKFSIICVQNPPGLSSPNSPLSLLFRAWI